LQWLSQHQVRYSPGLQRGLFVRIKFMVVSLSMAVATGAISAAASAGPVAGASTTESLSSIMQYLSGSWSCKVVANAFQPTKVGTTYKVTRALESNGVWFTETGTDFHSRYTFDSGTNELWYVYYNDRGSFNVSSSGGWTGRTLVFKNAIRDPRALDQEDTLVTFSKLGTAKYDRTFVLTSGKKRRRFDDVCSK
jgi:hypothetical protein